MSERERERGRKKKPLIPKEDPATIVESFAKNHRQLILPLSATEAIRGAPVTSPGLPVPPSTGLPFFAALGSLARTNSGEHPCVIFPEQIVSFRGVEILGLFLG